MDNHDLERLLDLFGRHSRSLMEAATAMLARNTVVARRHISDAKVSNEKFHDLVSEIAVRLNSHG